jgi:hypothetical protein
MLDAAHLQSGRRVAYHTPQGKEYGTVSSWNDYYVFVKFDVHVQQHGWDGATAHACTREQLTVANLEELEDGTHAHQ